MGVGFHDAEQSGTGTGTQSVDRSVALLDLIVAADEPRSFTSLVDELGLARSTTSRLLQALERGRLVQRDRSGSFRPGAMFAIYAARQNAADDSSDLAELTQPMLERIAEETGETANFAIPRGGAVVQVAQVDGAFLLGATNWIGVDVPAHCSAQGKVFLAHQRLSAPATLERRTPQTLTTRAALDRELADVRRQGWASTNEELEVGLLAVAAPVRAADGLVIGALSATGPTARIPQKRVPTIAAVVVEQATAASTQLGYTRKAGAA